MSINVIIPPKLNKFREIMAINFNLFLDSRRGLDTLPAKEAALLQGAVIEHSGQRYHVQILSTRTEDGEKARLIFRMYTGTKHEIRCFDEGKKGHFTYIGDKGLADRAAPLTKTFYKIILEGTIIEEAETLIFGGALTAEETGFYETHQELMPSVKEAEEEEIIHPEPTTGWTRPQKASALIVMVLGTITIAYGAKKVATHYDLKAPKMPTLEDLKASLEKLRNWRKGAAAA